MKLVRDVDDEKNVCYFIFEVDKNYIEQVEVNAQENETLQLLEKSPFISDKLFGLALIATKVEQLKKESINEDNR